MCLTFTNFVLANLNLFTSTLYTFVFNAPGARLNHESFHQLGQLINGVQWLFSANPNPNSDLDHPSSPWRGRCDSGACCAVRRTPWAGSDCPRSPRAAGACCRSPPSASCWLILYACFCFFFVDLLLIGRQTEARKWTESCPLPPEAMHCQLINTECAKWQPKLINTRTALFGVLS